MAEQPDRMTELRAKIDSVDDRLLELLNERARYAEEVAKAKAESGGKVYVPKREREIIDRLKDQNRGPFPGEGIRPVFQEIISFCLSLQKGLRVAFLGPEATFTHQAVKRHFGTSALTVPCGAISAVFSEVERGQADFGVVPVENSTEGVVSHTLDSFLDSNLAICAEIVVNVEHCLVARPGVTFADVERVYSHPQALGQCRNWLQANLPKATTVPSASTAEAARTAYEDAHSAAISSELAARLYSLVVLREGLQDVKDNITRFLVIGKPGSIPPETGEDYKTSIALALPDKPGWLFRALMPLSDSGINLTKIESRPSRKRAWAYVFFLDIDGHAQAPEIAPVLEKVASACEMFRVLGAYRKADPR
jgi:chorismate mutase/prephenate dehydratase